VLALGQAQSRTFVFQAIDPRANMRCVSSQDGSIVVQISADQRIKVWEVRASDVASVYPLRQEFTPPDHLDVQFTSACVEVIVLKTEPKVVKAALLALGTSEGNVMIWDLLRGENTHTLGQVCFSFGAPNALVKNKQSKTMQYKTWLLYAIFQRNPIQLRHPLPN
jgi:hypothetical protein